MISVYVKVRPDGITEVGGAGRVRKFKNEATAYAYAVALKVGVNIIIEE